MVVKISPGLGCSVRLLSFIFFNSQNSLGGGAGLRWLGCSELAWCSGARGAEFFFLENLATQALQRWAKLKVTLLATQ